jgi:hypothetical protein
MKERGSITNYTLRLVDYSTPDSKGKKYASQFPVVYECTDKKLMQDFMRAFYPHAKLLPVMGEETRKFFSDKNADGFPRRPFLYLIITPLYCHSYIEDYSID